MDAALAPDGFAFNGIRKFAIEIATKHWADGEPFSYEAAATSFEIDYLAWQGGRTIHSGRAPRRWRSAALLRSYGRLPP